MTTAQTQWREGFVSGGSTRFFVRALGQGDDLVLALHGWPETSRAWSRVAPMLVEAGYRVVCPDLKGFGRSSTPRHGYDPETLADEISQLIRNLHVRRAVLIGHDWGGAVALATAFRHPGRVNALVMASSPYRQLDLRRSWHIPLMNIPIAPELAFSRFSDVLVPAAIRHAAKAKEAFTEDVLQEYAEGVSRDPGAWLTYYRSLSRRAVTDWAMRRVRKRAPFLSSPRKPNTLRVPALVVWGEDDPATPHHLAGRVAYDLDGKLVSLPGVGHFPHEEDPLAFGRAVVDFIGAAPALADGGTTSAAG